MKIVNWNCKKKDGCNPNFNYGFQWMKSISGPRRWIGGLMMNGASQQ